MDFAKGVKELYLLARYSWRDTSDFQFVESGAGEHRRTVALLTREARPSAKDYLRWFFYEYSWADLWLKYGREFISPAPEQSPLPRMRHGYCYSNAYEWSERAVWSPEYSGKKVEYALGLAVGVHGIAAHAWVVVDDEVYDPTWADADLTSYFGIAFDPRWIHKVWGENGYCAFLEEWDWSRFEDIFEARLALRETL